MSPLRQARYDERELLTLPMPYFCQRDSAIWQGHRMCFSSSCAMAAAFHKPGCLGGAGKPDDRYLALVERFGDTTNSQAQVAGHPGQLLHRWPHRATDRPVAPGLSHPCGLAPPWDRVRSSGRWELEPCGGLGSSHPPGAHARSLRRSQPGGRRLREHRHRQRQGTALFRAELGSPLDGGGRGLWLVAGGWSWGVEGCRVWVETPGGLPY